MKRYFLCNVIFCLLLVSSRAQDVPNFQNAASLAPDNQKASQMNSVPVNIFTGMPNISVPIYSYTNAVSGLSTHISADYFSGGVQVSESPTNIGLGWYLSAGGSIVRNVRGMPDDDAPNGYLYSSAIPTDFRANGNKYYYDSLDTQQDVFQFNFNGRSGKFYIGKNWQIVSVPTAKIKIIPSTGAGIDTLKIVSFRIITEDGTKYDFADGETSSVATSVDGDTAFFHSGYSGHRYYSAWQLTRIIAPFSTDTIKFTYTFKNSNFLYGFPQVTFVRNSDGVRTVTYKPTGGTSNGHSELSSISFPDNTSVSFVYSNIFRYDGSNRAIGQIRIADTAFRSGYLFDYDTAGSVFGDVRMTLRSITPFTAREKKAPYRFAYSGYLPEFGSAGDSIANKRDYWGFFNNANNGDMLIPNVNGYTWGADRSPSAAALSASLTNVYPPTGGMIVYTYELNDHWPYTKEPQSFSLTPSTTVAQQSLSLSQVLTGRHTLNFTLDKSVSRQGTAPVSGSGNFVCALKSSDGSVTYASATFSLYDLFYLGTKSWSLTVPNGSYRLDMNASSGTSITGSFPVNITWENRTPDTAHLFTLAGGIRVARIDVYSKVNDSDAVRVSSQQYKYVTEAGKSSGFLGDIPKYDYPFRQTVINGSTTVTDYTVVSSEPLSTMDFAQGSPVGYGRVEVTAGTPTRNSGKTVYEFTDLSDLNASATTLSFPYAPQEMRSWGLGLPKRISMYDSSGRLVKRTVNTWHMDTVTYQGSNFKSLKLGNSATTYNGDPAIASTPKTKTFIGQEYYPEGGTILLSSTADTLFHDNGTYNADATFYVYDTNFNVKKVITNYDKSRGLTLEHRNYYPYDYVVGGVIGKLRDSAIITTQVASENWITGDANPRMIGGTAVSFKQTARGYIKPDTLFGLETIKPLIQSVIGTFDSSKLVRNSSYFRPQQTFSGYDSSGNPIEIRDTRTGTTSSVIMDYNARYVTARVANAAIADVAYTSFESGAGNWTIASPLRDTAALTGKKSYNLSNGNITKSGLSTAQTYLLTVWAKAGSSVSINGTALSTVLASHLGWNLYSTALTSVSGVTVSGSGPVDELRLHPKDANMQTFTYEPTVGMTSITDENNTVSYYTYDNLNRVKTIRDKDRNLLKWYAYSDTSMQVNVNPDWQFYETLCSGGGWKDSLYIDNNLFSASFKGIQYGAHVFDPCRCADPGVYPAYKLVNNVCEQGLRVNTSSVRTKVNGVFKWICTYHYEWSDSSQSGNYTETNDAPCPLGSEQ